MSKLSMFNFVTANGFFKGDDGDISWSTHDDPGSDFALENLQQDHTLLFGRLTYQQMASFWPSPEAMKFAPALAERMNKSEKIVFSRTLTKAEWQNSRLVKDDLVATIRELKRDSGKDMTVLGSGTIVTQLATANLIDEYGIMVHPVFLGSGTPMLQGIDRALKLVLSGTRSFKNGTVLLSYRRA